MMEVHMGKFELNLHLFDGGAAGGAGGGAGEAGAAGAAGAEGGQSAQAGQGQRPGKRANPLADVKYGKQAEDMQATAEAARESETIVTTDAAEERRAAFEQLIKGEYKDQFAERTQKIIDTRFKEQKALEARQQATQPILEALASKYGVDATDPEALMKAIGEDDSYFAEEADKKGLTVEQLKNLKRLEAENAQFRQAKEAQEKRAGSERVMAKWHQEGEACAQMYPGFELSNELRHPETGERFMSLLRNGVDVKTAYEVIHKDELLGGAIQYAVNTAQRRTMDNIRARGMRPSENGASGNATAQNVKRDPSTFTRADRDEIARRVQRGERIEL
jgi:pimeloyl-CoA synthetase